MKEIKDRAEVGWGGDGKSAVSEVSINTHLFTGMDPTVVRALAGFTTTESPRPNLFLPLPIDLCTDRFILPRPPTGDIANFFPAITLHSLYGVAGRTGTVMTQFLIISEIGIVTHLARMVLVSALLISVADLIAHRSQRRVV